jgi:hypothetical protein
MHCIVLPVKFDGGVSISFLRKKQLFFKKKDFKSPSSTPAIWRKGRREKSHFFEARFSCEQDGLTQKCFFPIDGYQESQLCLDGLTFLIPLQLIAFEGATRSVHVRILRPCACLWVSFDRYALHRIACEVLRWVVHQKFTFSNSSNFLISKPAIWRKDRWKKSHFFEGHFSCERDGQPTFKFEIDSEVLFTYRWLSRKLDFLGWLDIFYTTPIGRFWSFSESSRPHTTSKCLSLGICR